MSSCWIIQLTVYPEDLFWLCFLAVGIGIVAWRIARWTRKD